MTEKDRRYYLLALRIAGDFGISLAAPVVIFAWIGKKLDERWQTAPYLLIAGFAIAAILSAVIIYRKAKKYGREFE